MSIEKFLIKKNIAKNKQQANAIMIGIIVLCLLFFVIKNIQNNSNKNPDPYEGLTEEEIMQLQEFDVTPEDAILPN